MKSSLIKFNYEFYVMGPVSLSRVLQQITRKSLKKKKILANMAEVICH